MNAPFTSPLDNDSNSNPTQSLPQTPTPAPNVTPFDTQLVDDPNAPRYTQPLPNSVPFSPQPTNASTNAPTKNASTNASPNYAPRTLPPQVTPSPQGSGNAAPTSSTRSSVSAPQIAPSVAPPIVPISPTSSLPASRVPTATLVGLAAVGGALIVVFGSAFFRKMAPVPEPEKSNSTIIVERRPTPQNPTKIVIMPRATDEFPKSNGRVVSPSIEKEQTASDESISEPDNTDASRSSDAKNTDNTESNNVSSDEMTPKDEVLTTDKNNSDAEVSNRSDASDSLDEKSADETTAEKSPRFIERRRAYSIRPPREFRLTQKGRRTIWKSENGAQLLVEVGTNDGETPRAGWEKLDRSLQKKYGAKYQNRGIRETTVNGREAAVWEFDLTQKNGATVRKMDVAFVDNKSGYAVLASAPVEKFEAMRPTFNRVLESFQIENSDTSPTPNGY